MYICVDDCVFLWTNLNKILIHINWQVKYYYDLGRSVYYVGIGTRAI